MIIYKFPDPSIKVFIYKNLHRDCWSIKSMTSRAFYGRVLMHADMIEVVSASFKVSENGRRRVLRTKNKNVHAGVVGYLKTAHVTWTNQKYSEAIKFSKTKVEDTYCSTNNGKKISYNPYKNTTFVFNDGKEISPYHEFPCVKLNNQGCFLD